jgi:VanZ family protein
MRRIFLPDSPYKKQARFIAILWTLLIIVACFTPGKDLPKVDIPLIDKWTHFVLFGVLVFLWLCSRPVTTLSRLAALFVIATAFGAAIEVMQGVLTFLGRSMELMDGVADSIGALLGIAVFCLCAYFAKKGRPDFK